MQQPCSIHNCQPVALAKVAFHSLGLSWLLKTLIVCSCFVLLATGSSAAPVYFLMAHRPLDCVILGGGWWNLNTSYVVPLESSEDIAHARAVVRNDPCEPRPFLRMRAAPASDGLNRNHLAPNAPFWDWHITQADAFLYDILFPAIFDPLAPAPHTLHDPEVMAIVIAGGGWIDQRNTIVAELNPNLTTRMQIKTNGELALLWDNLGAFYAFTVEQRDIAADSDWLAVPEMTWPIRESSWTIPSAAQTSPSRLYRVRAELTPPVEVESIPPSARE